MFRKCIITLLFSITFSLALTSCSYNPFSTDNELTGNPGGAAVGAGVGAGGAALLGASKYVIGLAGLGGASLGYYLTTVNFASGGVVKAGGQVYSVGDYVTIEFPTDTVFDENSADILPEARPALDSTISVLQHYPNNNIIISGNTSGYGPRRYEFRISEARARAVAAYLWAHGISSFKATDATLPTRKLSYVGYGNSFPIANNIKASGIRANSRIQITSYPTNSQLNLCKEQRIFANIGAMNADAEPLTPTPTPTHVGDDFNGDLLPDSR
jgi:outer membrane protein OmpA-like peptidoglycan-associated protein